MKEKNRGITLIALVITVIVVIILVGVSIKLVVDSGMVNTADKAGKEYRLAGNDENNILDNAIINGEDFENYVPLKQINAGERATFKSLYGSVVVPAGFTVSMIPSEQNVENGLVIYDIPEGENVNWDDVDSVQTKYNQFVYVPSGNFYVGRYEVGCEEERTADTVELSTPLLKRYLYPYNYVTYEEASSLCKQMYPELNIELCSFEELQIMDSFMSDVTGLNQIANCDDFYGPKLKNPRAYIDFGNFSNTSFIVYRDKFAIWSDDGSDETPVYASLPDSPYSVVGTSGIYNEINEEEEEKFCGHESGGRVLLSTGAVREFSIKNIFDLYGNLSEYINYKGTPYCFCSYYNAPTSEFYSVDSYREGRFRHIGSGFRPVIHLD